MKKLQGNLTSKNILASFIILGFLFIYLVPILFIPYLFYGLIYYLIIFILFSVTSFFYFDFNFDKTGIRDILEIIYIISTITILFTSVFAVFAIKKEGEINIKSYLCDEYQINKDIADDIIEAIDNNELTNQRFQNLASLEYFKDYPYLLPNLLETIRLDYRMLEIANRKLERIDMISADSSLVDYSNQGKAALLRSYIDKEQLGTAGWIDQKLRSRFENRTDSLDCN